MSSENHIGFENKEVNEIDINEQGRMIKHYNFRPNVRFENCKCHSGYGHSNLSDNEYYTSDSDDDDKYDFQLV